MVIELFPILPCFLVIVMDSRFGPQSKYPSVTMNETTTFYLHKSFLGNINFSILKLIDEFQLERAQY